ncbi:GNAT family N-acetyltransferase [Mobilicoccus massiliensis]|uniref:GNAT family N-acetyltransferase n=1 Tax=Mobilicoccus massiliensis TaxID=1522310 RepID=UPI000693EF61|nr:GNAT family N-acetyltransferase [Mobilicoccus massiliensis]
MGAESTPPRAPELVIDGLVLNQAVVADAEDWAQAQDEECARWFGWPAPPGVKRCRSYLERVVAGEFPGSFVWAIRTADGFAGGIDLSRLDDRWNVAYFVHPRFRRRGIATAALCRVCDWAFGELRAKAVSSRVHTENTTSARVLSRVGFSRVARVPSERGGHVDDVYELHFRR